MAVLIVEEVTEVRDVVELITYLASWPAETPTHDNRRSWNRPGMKGPFPT